MANGYGSSSSTTQTTNGQDTQTRVAPPGFHYMPDGTLMSDAEHMALYGEPYNPKIITDFVINTNDIKASGELKSKPTQHSVMKLREIGLAPDMILCRSEYKIDKSIK